MTAEQALIEALPAGLVSLADHEKLAASRMDPMALAYFNGGAADEITLRSNPGAWQALSLHPRVLRSITGLQTQTELLGRTWPHPIMVAPMAYQRLAHPHGEAATALAAAAQGASLVLSTQSSTRLEDVARLYVGDTDRGALWFQLYLQADRGHTLELVHRAEAAGYEALVLTVDAPVHGVRDRERQAGFALPPHVRAVNLDRPGSDGTKTPNTLEAISQQAPDWDDVRWLLRTSRLPVILKGITHPDDARLAVEAGVAAIIVSNHGGRTLDTMPATARLLPGVVDAAQGRCPVLVDGGIRRGTDVLKALALGASAVLVGRPVMHGLANAGASGVAHVLRLLRDELTMAMALCGCSNVAQIQRHLVN
ncbi:MAG: alpha-hydroxy acid oxidase [Burkholderiaceae bacterium]